MKWSDKSIFQPVKHYQKKQIFVQCIIKKLLRQILNNSVNCEIDKLALFFCWYHLLAKCVIVSGTRWLAPYKWSVCHQLKCNKKVFKQV